MIHVDVFAQAVRHGDIYARSEIWNNNFVVFFFYLYSRAYLCVGFDSFTPFL